MRERKADAARIEARLDGLKRANWIGPARQWWPKYVFRFDDIQNAVRILQCGRLLCRAQRGEALETASREVLGHTEETWKNHVRLYFRPRTPTQYQVEGFRPKGQLGSLQAHMPVPVFFLFDANEILTRASTKFSNGNLAAAPAVGQDADFFESIPFEKVYHDSWMSESEKANIKFHRHAEVIVPGELDLDALHFVWLRTEAEYKTLVHLLPAAAVKKYGPKFRHGKKPNLHFCNWSFVESASLEQNKISLVFNASTRTPGPFAAHLAVRNRATGADYKWENPEFQANGTLSVGIPQITKAAAYDVRFTLDGAVAYADRFAPKTISF
jgi:hypothetical protein